MSELEVLNLILDQIGNLRIPMREEELRSNIGVIARNVQALRDAVAKGIEEVRKEAEKDSAGHAESNAEEAANDV